MKVVLTDMIGFFKTLLPKGKKSQVETEFAVPREQSPLINGANRQPAQGGKHPFEAGGLTGDTPFSPPPQPGFQDTVAQQLPPSFQGQAHEQLQQAPSSHAQMQVSGQVSEHGSVQAYGQNQVIGQPQPQNQFPNTPQFSAGHQNQIDAQPQTG